MPNLRSGSALFRHRGLKIVGVLNRPEGPDGRRFPAVLFLHGFPGAEKNVDVQRGLLARGVASFAPNFSGAWGSEGEYSFSGLVPQAKAALALLRAQPFVDRRRVAVFGFSMGGWTALNLAAREPSLVAAVAVAPVGGPEVVGPMTRGRIAGLSAPLRVRSVDFLHGDFIEAVGRYDPHAAVRRLRRPLLLVHGDADDVVPIEVSRRLYAEAAGPKRFVRAKGAQHDFLDRREWFSRLVCGWLVRRLRQG